jgi:Lrp/AsnC family leucine-responsive transcriptional regulator
MSKLRKFDKTDAEILNMLQRNAKLTNKEIASELNLTTTPVYERIKRLEKDGLINRYVAIVDQKRVGLPLTAFCHVSLKSISGNSMEEFEQNIEGVSEINECHYIAGAFDYLLKIIIADMPSFQIFLKEKIATLPNIRQVQSSFVMTTVKEDTSLFLKVI